MMNIQIAKQGTQKLLDCTMRPELNLSEGSQHKPTQHCKWCWDHNLRSNGGNSTLDTTKGLWH